MGLKKEIIVVADFFANELIGGGELTLDAILEACPFSYQQVKSQNLTESFIQENKEKHWLFGNFAGVSKSNLIEIIRTVRKFSVLEMDYKYCQHRSSHLHKARTGKECDCHQQDCGRFILGMFNRANKIFFMSQGQLNEYKRLFPVMEKMGQKLVVQGSTFSRETLEFIQKLNQENKPKIESDRWIILDSQSWIKGTKETEEYCKKRGLKTIKCGSLPHIEYLKLLSNYPGLIFHPLGFDTNPRITIEAKLLGLELDLNDNVQQKYDDWFNLPVDQLYDYLFDLPQKFWEKFDI